MGYWKRTKSFLQKDIDILDLAVRIIALAIVFYIVYYETQQQILAIACLVVVILGIRKINKYALIAIDKFEHSKKGKIPWIGEYETVEDKTKEAETPAPLSKSIQAAMLKADSFADALGKASKFIMHKEWDGAAYFIEQALQFNPDDLNLRLQLTSIYGERIGDKGKAIKHCEEVLKRDPENVSAMFNLAVYTNHWKGSKDSLPIYLKAEKLIEKKGLSASEIDGKLNIFVGHDCKNTGDKVEARIRYNKAISILGKLAEQGDQASAFWLKDARKNLDLLG
jgi:tetratricopeptide (TPR) repeat protein